MSDTYVLLRNGLYAGKMADVTPIAETAVELMRKIQQRSGRNDFSPIEGEEVKAVLERAKAFQGLVTF